MRVTTAWFGSFSQSAVQFDQSVQLPNAPVMVCFSINFKKTIFLITFAWFPHTGLIPEAQGFISWKAGAGFVGNIGIVGGGLGLQGINSDSCLNDSWQLKNENESRHVYLGLMSWWWQLLLWLLSMLLLLSLLVKYACYKVEMKN